MHVEHDMTGSSPQDIKNRLHCSASETLPYSKRLGEQRILVTLRQLSLFSPLRVSTHEAKG